MQAIESDDEAAMRGLLRGGLDPDSSSEDGPLLFLAACYGAVGAARALLDAGADIRARGDEGETVVHMAVEYGHVEMAQLLYPLLPSEELDHFEFRPMILAAGNGDLDMIRALESLGEPLAGLHVAVMGGHEAVLAYLLGRVPLDEPSPIGLSLVHAAVRQLETAALAQLLLVDELDVMSADPQGYTPIEFAATHGHVAALDLLAAHPRVELGHAVELAESKGWSSLARRILEAHAGGPLATCRYCHGQVLAEHLATHEQVHARVLPNGQSSEHVTLPTDAQHMGDLAGVPRHYRHHACGAVTTMPEDIIRSYLVDPFMYDDTSFCCGCEDYVPISELVWMETGQTLLAYTRALQEAARPD